MKLDRELLLAVNRTEDELWKWVETFCGLRVPRRAMCAGHAAPFEYLRRAYFEPATDLVVWGPRGGGKTKLGAVATLLDLLHKPGIEVKILGGSLEQSFRMWEHLLPEIERYGVGKAKARAIVMSNGSRAGVLTQSQRAVRGVRVQKLRCDEVEMFDREVWEAAQLVTRSKPRTEMRGSVAQAVTGTIEALSTFHNAYGLMGEIVDRAKENGTPVLRWCLMEVLERCPAERECATCPLWAECQGRAKTQCEGFFSIDDAIKMKSRVSRESWESEMLCQRPSTRGRVFPTFDPAVHVRETNVPPQMLAMDFGFANPFVCLWIGQVGEVVHVIDEYVQDQRTIDEHVREIESRGKKVKRIACDPAGNGANEQTGQSTVQLLRKSGYWVSSCKSGIVEGCEKIRAVLKNGNGESRLIINPRCKRLIKAMEAYRYEPGQGEKPLKDGEHDHLIDALRYYFANRSKGEAKAGRY